MTGLDQTTHEDSARCYRHPDRLTNVSCTRCGRPICPACLREAPVGFQCPSCVDAGNRRVNRGRSGPRLPYGGRVARRPAAVTIVLGAMNVAMFVITAATSPLGANQNHASAIFVKLVLNPAQTAYTNQYWRFISSAFLHYGILHLAVNMFSLAVLGPGIERVLGAWRYGVLYVVSALGGSVAVYAFDNKFTSVAGASAAIFGLFGALAVLYRKLGLDLRALVPTILLNVWITFSVPNISWLGHLGGFVAGGLVAFAIIYAPTARRAVYQLSGVGLVLVALAGIALWRTLELHSMIR